MAKLIHNAGPAGRECATLNMEPGGFSRNPIDVTCPLCLERIQSRTWTCEKCGKQYPISIDNCTNKGCKMPKALNEEEQLKQDVKLLKVIVEEVTFGQCKYCKYQQSKKYCKNCLPNTESDSNWELKD